jgi:hypothetical protein
VAIQFPAKPQEVTGIIKYRVGLTMTIDHAIFDFHGMIPACSTDLRQFEISGRRFGAAELWRFSDPGNAEKRHSPPKS